MRKTLLAALAFSFMLTALPARADKLDAPLFEAILATARSYAADRNLVFYCLRKNDDMRPFLYAAVHLDIAYTMQLLRTAGADDRQRAQLIEAVLANIRPVEPKAAEDPALTRQCAGADAENALAKLTGVGKPLFMRPPFEKLKP
ncbi:MAG TPA: hypothetical protein VKT73_07285 [Xanthobacteraceae bacterium]|nr:hypothetical protein [Xanthobacteraceae bacterium]